MILRTRNTLVCFCWIFLSFLHTTNSRAVSLSRSPRLTRDVYPEDVTSKQSGSQVKVCIFGDLVFGAGEAVGSSDPCEKCECRPPAVECQPIQCPPRSPGCRALHRPDQCCPQYQCECTIGNRTYANGERLEVNPESPCKVCYCRGGEVQCANVGCYTRNDCEPMHVPGQCCPKYDNCPPRDSLSDHSSSSSEQPLFGLDQELLASWPTTVPTQASSNSPDLIPRQPTSSSEYDDTIDGNGAESVAQNDVDISLNNNKDISVENIDTNSRDASTQTSSEFIPAIKNPPSESKSKITIKEILPVKTEYPMASPPKREINQGTNFNSNDESGFGKSDESKDHAFTSNDGSGEKNSDSNMSNELDDDLQGRTTEISEVYFKVGDQLLLYLNKGNLVPGQSVNTPASVITVIGAEGLVRGVEESDEFMGDHHDLSFYDGLKFSTVGSSSLVSDHDLSVEVSSVTDETFPSSTTGHEFTFSSTPISHDISTDSAHLYSSYPLNTEEEENLTLENSSKPSNFSETSESSEEAMIVGEDLSEEKTTPSDTTDGPTRIPLTIPFIEDLLTKAQEFEATNTSEESSSSSSEPSTTSPVTTDTPLTTEENTSLSSSPTPVSSTTENPIEYVSQLSSVSMDVETVGGVNALEEGESEHNPAYPPLPEDLLEPYTFDTSVHMDTSPGALLSNEMSQEEKGLEKSEHPMINEDASLPLALITQKTASDISAEADSTISDTVTTDTTSESSDINSSSERSLLTTEIPFIDNETSTDENNAPHSTGLPTEWLKDNDTAIQPEMDDKLAGGNVRRRSELTTPDQFMADQTDATTDENESVNMSTSVAYEFITTENSLINFTTADTSKSTETVEDSVDSGESVTEENKVSSLMSNEDASVQLQQDASSPMVRDDPLEGPTSDENVAKETTSLEDVKEEVELLPGTDLLTTQRGIVDNMDSPKEQQITPESNEDTSDNASVITQSSVAQSSQSTETSI